MAGAGLLAVTTAPSRWVFREALQWADDGWLVGWAVVWAGMLGGLGGLGLEEVHWAATRGTDWTLPACPMYAAPNTSATRPQRVFHCEERVWTR